MATVFFLSLILLAISVSTQAFHVETISFDEGYKHLFGEDNMVKTADGRGVNLVLNRYTGSGFISSNNYMHGYFSASIKLPKENTAGVVVAFYLSNGDVFEKDHDELDWEFLGNKKGKEWRVQTNIYDDIPIREVIRSEAMGSDFPSKPMAVYATIWDGSAWATDGGKVKINYKYSPFVAEFSELVLRGCPSNPIQQSKPSVDLDRCASTEVQLMTADFAVMTPKMRSDMRRLREKQMTYTVCYDTVRYQNVFPDCDNTPEEQEKFWQWGESKLVKPRTQSLKRRSRSQLAVGSLYSSQAAD
ncbi:putative xyloglucan endotransglucosylase/hydrolase protein 30 [Carex littledalei]|uniref:Xyloglucan endotransglucosylase/hydrolase n=1 Tax=Carex littledalei TaxID=544730 RepID=A0A833QC59_9POAL|nr:putative xyloglucan endotransglucosylase/hydrolase protein 30 [Carex littledalei]